MSQTIASSAPPPRQCPCTAATVTFLLATRARITAWNLTSIPSTLSGVCAATSTPAEKALPAPLSTTTERSERASISPSACASSSIIAMSMTFTGGWLNTSRATGGAMFTTTRARSRSINVEAMIASVVKDSDLQIDRRLPDLTDARQRIAGPSLLRNPFLLRANDLQQQLLVLGRRHIVFQVLRVRAIVELFARLRVKLLPRPAPDLAIELDMRRIQSRLTRL